MSQNVAKENEMSKLVGVNNAITDTKSLRDFLVDQMSRAASGNLEPDRGKAVANFAQQIYNTLNIELRMAIARSKLGDAKVESVKFSE